MAQGLRRRGLRRAIRAFGSIRAFTSIRAFAGSSLRGLLLRGLTASRATDMRRWIGLLERIEEFARAEGCEATRIIGRKGWARVLTSYQTKRIVLEKDL